MEHRKLLELEHDRKLAGSGEIAAWGWHGPAGSRRLKRRSDLINDFIMMCAHDARDRVSVLELGCGTGLLTKALNLPDGRLISLDIYEGFVRKAYGALRKQDQSASLLVADAESLPFPEASFDCIVGISILHHLDLGRALLEIKRVLKRGGRFMFSEPNMLNPQIFIQKNIPFIKRALGDSPSETAFFAHAVRRDFLRHGLRVEVRHFDFLHPLVPKAYVDAVEALGRWLEKYTCIKYIAGSLLIEGEKMTH
jgi:ubiquinone/menaquinone biosynthesis C-methylase UbiE